MAARYFPDLPQLGPQPWPQPSGQASTVMTWDSPGQWRVLRRGARCQYRWSRLIDRPVAPVTALMAFLHWAFEPMEALLGPVLSRVPRWLVLGGLL